MKAIPALLDTADTEILEELVRVMDTNNRPGWIDISNMRSSRYGMYIYIDCHIVMPWYWDLNKISEELQQVQAVINNNFKQHVDLVIQAEPCKPGYCAICRIEECPVRQHPFQGQKVWVLNEVLQKLEPL